LLSSVLFSLPVEVGLSLKSFTKKAGLLSN
jgi:hypothetical protein